MCACVSFRAFEQWKKHCANTNAAQFEVQWNREGWRGGGEKLSDELLHVVKTAFTWPCLFFSLGPTSESVNRGTCTYGYASNFNSIKIVVITRVSQKVPGIFFYIDCLLHHEIVLPGHRECHWSLLRASYAEGAARQVAGRDSGFWIRITHRVTHSLVCHHPATVLSGSRSEWLSAVPSRRHVSQHGGHQVKWHSRTLQDSKRSLSQLLPTVAGSMEQVSVCVCVHKMIS
jgi:hypothetical protein